MEQLNANIVRLIFTNIISVISTLTYTAMNRIGCLTMLVQSQSLLNIVNITCSDNYNYLLQKQYWRTICFPFIRIKCMNFMKQCVFGAEIF